MVAKKHSCFPVNCCRPESVNDKDRLKRGRSEKIIMTGSATRKSYDFNNCSLKIRQQEAALPAPAANMEWPTGSLEAEKKRDG